MSTSPRPPPEFLSAIRDLSFWSNPCAILFCGLCENSFASSAVSALPGAVIPALGLPWTKPHTRDRLRLRPPGDSSRPCVRGFQQDGHSEKWRSGPDTRTRTAFCEGPNRERGGRLDRAACAG